MEREGKYVAASNMLNINFFWSASPHTPINKKAMQAHGRVHYPCTISRFTDTFIIGVLPGDPLPYESKGAWKLISPLELAHSPLLRIEEQLPDMTSLDSESTAKAMLTTSFLFIKCTDEDDLKLKARQQRELFSATHTLVSVTPVQSIFEIVGLKKSLGGA